MFQRAFGRIAYQSARITHFIHDFVAGINTRRTADTLVLQTVADIDTDGTDLYAHGAVDAVTQPAVFFIGGFLACAARFAAFGIVRTSRFGSVHTDTYAGTLSRA